MSLQAVLFDSGGVEVGTIEIPFISHHSQLISGGNFHYSIEYKTTLEELKEKPYLPKKRLLCLTCKTFVCDEDVYFMVCHWRYKALIKYLYNNTIKCNPITFKKNWFKEIKNSERGSRNSVSGVR